MVCCKLWSILLTEGKYCAIFFPRVVRWGLDCSRAHFFVLDSLMGRESCAAESSRGGEEGADVVLVSPSREGEVGGVARSDSMAVLSSGAFRLMSSFISCSLGCVFCHCRCWSSLSLLEVVASSGSYWSMRDLLPVRFEPSGRASSSVRSQSSWS